MYNKLPYKIDPIEFAKQQSSVEGELDLSKMSRLKSVCCDPLVGEAQVWVEGDIDYEGLPYLHGTVVATLPLMCQHCMGVVRYPLSIEFFLRPVFNDDEARSLPSSYEPLYLSNSTVSLLEMIEDELLLSLPLTVRHEEQDCFVKD